MRVDSRARLTREGDEFWVTYRLGSKDTQHLARVSKFVPETLLELVLTSDKMPRGTRLIERYELSPGAGHVRLTQTVDLDQSGAPWWARALMSMLQHIGKPMGKRYLETLKECVEAASA